VDACCTRAFDRFARAEVNRGVFADQRAVEITRDCTEIAREVGRELQCFVVRNFTSASI
jgi:hypothetical protein